MFVETEGERRLEEHHQVSGNSNGLPAGIIVHPVWKHLRRRRFRVKKRKKMKSNLGMSSLGCL